MHVWLVKLEEPLPIDAGYRPYRMGMLSAALLASGHSVTRWASDYDHLHHVYRTGRTGIINVTSGLRLYLLHQKISYKKSVSVKRIFNNLLLAKKFERAARYEKPPDVIVCAMPTPELAAASARLARRFKVPLVLDARDLWPDIIGEALKTSLHKLLAYPILYMMRRNLRYAASNSASLVGITTYYRAHLLRYAGRKKGKFDKVFNLGFDGNSITIGGKEREEYSAFWDALGVRQKGNQFNIYFAGRLNGTIWKAFKPIRDAAVQLRERAPEVQFVFCGSGDYESRIEEMAGGLDNILFAGEVCSGSLRVLQERSHVSLLCVERRRDYQMSLSNKFFEYLQAAHPILSSLDGLPGEILEENECGFVYGNADELVSRILILTRYPKERIRLGENAKRLLEDRFSAARIYSEFVVHMEDLVNSVGKTDA